MAMHATIDPEKAVRWERKTAVDSLVKRVIVAAVIVVAGVGLLAAAARWDASRGVVPAEVTEASASDGLSTVRYTDASGTQHLKRLNIGPAVRGERVNVRVPKDDPDNPMREDSLVPTVVGFVPWAVMALAVVPLWGVPPLVVRIEKSGRARAVLGTPPIKATFDYHKEQEGRQASREFRARIAPRDDVWKERMVYLGKERPALDPTDTHDVTVIGEVRGTEPLIVVGDSWSLVVLR